jgi:hypothetical protein
VLFLVNVYRAATQSFTTDEAFTYNSFVDARLSKMWLYYDANNHVLNTLLEKVTVRLFGLSEFSLRLPSLLLGGLYLASVWAVCRRLFGAGALFLAGVALLSLNPLVLDFLSAARGYGMALAFWMWALVFLLDCLEGSAPPEPAKLYLAGVALGLSVSSNLAFLFPAASTAAAFAALWLCGRRYPWRTRWTSLADRFVVPGVAVAFVILVLPVSRAGPDLFYYGAGDLKGALYALIDSSLYHGSTRDPVFARAVFAGVSMAVMALMAAAAAACVRLVRRRGQGRVDAFLLLAGPAILLTLAGTVAAHRGLGMPYPLVRTAIYWIPLLTLLSLALLTHFHYRGLQAGGLVLAACFVALYLLRFQVSFYSEWQDDASIRLVARELRSRAGNRPVRIGASFPEHVTMEFYRRRLGMWRWLPVERLATGARFDYYVLLPSDSGLPAQRNLEVLYRAGPLTLAR